jgi:putative ABC transport system substrate-binding protein
LVPKAVRVAVLVNPASDSATETTLREVRTAAGASGLQIQVLNASTSNEIDAAFATLARERSDALFVAPDSFFGGRRLQLANLAAREDPAAADRQCRSRRADELRTDILEFASIGVYTGSILKGAKPADLPVVQSTKFELVVNLRPPRRRHRGAGNALATADELIK